MFLFTDFTLININILIVVRMVQWDVNITEVEEGKDVTESVVSVGEGKRTHLWQYVYTTMLIFYVATCVTLGAFRDFGCSLDGFLVVWWTAEAVFLFVGTIFEFVHIRRVDDSDVDVRSRCPLNCDLLLVIWGVIGIIGTYMVQHQVDTVCSMFQWSGLLIWSIVSIVIVVVGRISIKVC
uniref:uncharacterized protein LOC120332992 n=1 Tax=Styela clava TaxID=7725 RepID=UPI00193A84C9|nr:uncharacterized protein LOC120332992 [Styela clava]